MTFVDRVAADLLAAMKAGDAVRVSTLRMLKADLLNAAIAQRLRLKEAAPETPPGARRRPAGPQTGAGQPQAPLGEPQALDVLRRQIKQRREALEAFQAGGRHDLVTKESQELTILQEYVPPPLSEEALRAIVQECVRAAGATSPRDFGKVMRMVMERVKGQADGTVVHQLVAQHLAKGG